MAGTATFGPDDSVLVLKWAGLCCVALRADDTFIFLRLRSLSPLSITAVRFVTIGAQHDPLDYLMPERRRELSLLFLMALKAQIWLCNPEEMFRFSRGVDTVAADAAYISSSVCRTLVNQVRACVALKAGVVHLFRVCLRQVDHLRLVSAALNVCITRPVATCADACMRCVRIAGKIPGNTLMTAGTCQASLKAVCCRCAYLRIR